MVKCCSVHKLISWKRSFGRLNEEHELAKKKRQALDRLLDNGRISQATYKLFNLEIDDAIAEIDRQQKVLLERMASKMVELEGQIKTLEILLANFEIEHVAGEVEEETYQRETGLLSMGLETARRDLEVLKEAADQLSSGEFTVESSLEPPQQENQTAQPQVQPLDQPPPPVEKERTAVETLNCTEEAQPTQTEVKVEEKQES
jgi:hypothetical protein